MRETIRSFRGADAKEAFAAVRAALGGEAVVLSAREIPGGLLRKNGVEVLAMAHAPRSPARPLAELPPAPPTGHAAYAALSAPASSNVQALRPVPSQPPEPLHQRAPERPFDEALAGEILALRRSVEETRREMRSMAQRTRTEPGTRLRPATAAVFGKLIAGGVEDALADELVRKAARKDGATESGSALFDEARRLVRERLATGQAPWHPGPKRAIALVGPTGVGKTTTIAKIAARALLDSRMRVSLITVDTYRVGASEQLARYGEIMGVPSYVARSRDELAKALARSQDAELVLIDTAGRSTHEAVAQQAELLRSVPGVQLHLVCSAATGWRELAALADRYRGLRPDGLIFSKLDEAVAPGGVLSAAVRLSSRITCIADGQKVPDDLHEATAEELTERALASCRDLPLGRGAERERVNG
ncbi:flagellar biosynthesis protein FlhF [Vulgatibacter incomptus]|uniref:Flagellar biosynthesis protein FlhF n=1 Tax=Vulgatibacter incomptus TaxID=1391653 RepID=A0A0K1PHJ1_9BACT|nr:flagellar biosynthesis protein FlhF [Vulgatibacter incomptus]AKU93008.1 Flagellar biosynthesis protein FlhF [Vulgatibacter incomptus]